MPRPAATSRRAPARRGRTLGELERHGIEELKAVGSRRADAFRSIGVSSVLDLLMTYPYRHENRAERLAIAEVLEGQAAAVLGEIVRVSTRRLPGRRTMVEAVVADASGSLTCTFFNQPWRARTLSAGQHVVLFGRVNSYSHQLQMANPRLDVVDPEGEVPAGRIVPIYSESEKASITTALVEAAVGEALERAGSFVDPLPEPWRRRLRLIDRGAAFGQMHRPSAMGEVGPARRRLAFDELFRLQTALVMRKRAAAAASRGIAHLVDPEDPERRLVDRFVQRLPFALTGAQAKVIGEVAADLSGALPMHRLLQGDVGAGKTVVALAALLYGVQGGHQGALMAPTEVLAEQHYLGALDLLAGLEVAAGDRLGGRRAVRCELLTSRTPAGERARLIAALAAGEIDLVVGTHALITEHVRFCSLGVVVIDEQHRFGVDQRAALRDKGADGTAAGHDPDLLVMTATPIPRTAAMTVYGDLDYSVLDELPPGRAPVTTRWLRSPDAEAEAWETVRNEVAAGHQAFVVCPLVRPGGGEDDGEEDPDAPGARSAEEESARLAGGPLSGCRIGLLHGQLPARDKARVMEAMRRGNIDVLVATTVIEVGVDVPLSTVMVIEDADRFGIAQLHQLRGRVGRADLASYCYLLADEEKATTEAVARLEALERTTDGFELAEVDLDLRGEGTVLGARQKGRNDLKLASLRRDRDLVAQARDVADALVAADPTLEATQPLLADELRLFIGEEEAEYLFRS